MDAESDWPFCKVPTALLTDLAVSDGAKVTFAMLQTWLRESDSCWPSLDSICEARGISKTSARRHLVSLERTGWLSRDVTANRRTIHRLTPPHVDPSTRGPLHTWTPPLSEGSENGPLQERTPPHVDGGGSTCGHLTPPHVDPEVEEEKEKQEKKKQSRPTASTYTSDFLAWYEVYPRHAGKKPGAKAFKAALKRVDLETLTAGAKTYAALVKAERRDRRHIALPASWLNGDRWEDQTEEPEPATGQQPQGSSSGNGTDPAILDALDLLSYPDPYLRGRGADAVERLGDLALQAHERRLTPRQIGFAAKLAESLRPFTRNGISLDEEQRATVQAIELLRSRSRVEPPDMTECDERVARRRVAEGNGSREGEPRAVGADVRGLTG